MSWQDYQAGFARVRAAAKARRQAARKARLRSTTAERERCLMANVRTRRIGRRGEVDRSILLDVTACGIQRRYHATKGWRQERVEPA